MDFKCTIEPGSVNAVVSNLNAINKRLHESLRVISLSAAKQMEAYAKNNRKWTDRTGDARKLIKGDASWVNLGVLETVICHQVDYGVWLELAHGKRYAILDSAMKAVAPKLLEQYKKLVGA